MKVQQEQDTKYTITNSKVTFSISSTTGNASKTLGISIIIVPNSQVVKEELYSEKPCNLIGQ